MKYYRGLLFLNILLLLLSCCEEDEPYVNSYFADVYPQILDSIDIECFESDSPYYIKAFHDDGEICHYEGEDLRNIRFSIATTFTTSSPSFSPGDSIMNARKSPILRIGNPLINRQEYFKIGFPQFSLTRDPIEHLDSLFAIEYHDIVGEEDIVIPEGIDIAQEALLRATGGYLNKFKISLVARDNKYPNPNQGIDFIISTIFGTQEESFLRIKKVEKSIEFGAIYYLLDLEFECTLYHWPQYGYEGIWSGLRNGEMHVKFKAWPL